MRRSIVLVGALLILASATQCQEKAQEKTQEKTQEKAQEKAQEKTQEKAQEKKRELKDRVKLEGRIVCVGCTLAMEFGTNSQCTLHSKHAQGFLDNDGKLWAIVDNARGHKVMTNRKIRDQEIRVFGWPYKKHQHLEVWKYELKKAKKWIGYDFCKT